MLYRDPQSFPSPVHAPASVQGPGSSGTAEEAQLGQTGKRGLGRQGQGTAWLVQGAVGWLHVCTIFKGPTCSLHQLITEVQVKNSMRVNSISVLAPWRASRVRALRPWT